LVSLKVGAVLPNLFGQRGHIGSVPISISISAGADENSEEYREKIPSLLNSLDSFLREMTHTGDENLHSDSMRQMQKTMKIYADSAEETFRDQKTETEIHDFISVLTAAAYNLSLVFPEPPIDGVAENTNSIGTSVALFEE
jgi:hypothetical protein